MSYRFEQIEGTDRFIIHVTIDEYTDSMVASLDGYVIESRDIDRYDRLIRRADAQCEFLRALRDLREEIIDSARAIIRRFKKR